MKTKRSRTLRLILLGVAVLALAVGAYFFFKNRVDASTTCPQYSSPAPGWCSAGTIVASTPTPDGCSMPPTCQRVQTPLPTSSITSTVSQAPISSSTPTSTCPQIVPPQTGWCPNGQIQTQPNDANGCPQPPKCITNQQPSYTFNLLHGWNTIVMPQSMFNSENPISTSAFRLTGISFYGFTNNQWEVWPTYLRVNGSYLAYNSGQDTYVTVLSTGGIMIGVYNGYKLNPGWNLVGNNEQFARTLSSFGFTTYKATPNCTTMPACNESKTMTQLFTEGRIYNKIFFFNIMTSTDPNVFYTAKTLSSIDMTSYQIPALSAFWIYLYQ